jgi:hypothetical protein
LCRSRLGGATWRIFLTPVDTFKTTLQVQVGAALSTHVILQSKRSLIDDNVV